jgi:cytochrome P450
MSRTSPQTLGSPEPLPTERPSPFDPPECYRKLREACPITPLSFPDGRLGWLVTGFAASRELLADPRFSARNDRLVPPVPTELHSSYPRAPGAFSKMDEPEHGHYRRLLAGHFTFRRTHELAGQVERIIREQLTELAQVGQPADLVEHWADPIPARVICAWLGIDDDERGVLQEHVHACARLTTTPEEAYASRVAISEVLQALVERKRADPGDDLIGAMVRTGELDDRELVNVTEVLVSEGFETTANMLALGVFALLEHPDQLARLRTDPELLDGAVEELIRFLTIPHLGASRAAREDVEFHGQVIRKDEIVVVALPAANRDPARFPDPDVLDVGRTDKGHVGFGHGIHQCIGQHLARTTLRIGYREVLRCFPSLRLAVPADEVPMRDDQVHYGVRSLQVYWE